jgi:uncharacterized protein (TIGR02145 family)
MRTQLTKTALAAALGLALAFTLSCSGGDPDDNSGGNGDGSGGGGKGNDIANYRTVVIGTQRWMAENLDYNVNGSKCYNNNCDKYGRLYDWATAMALPGCGYGTSCASQIQAKHRGICPENWHIPSKAEWDALATYIEGDKGCTYCDAKHLKASSGWNENGNGTDAYEFSALPGGYGNSGGYFFDAGNDGNWWSATEYNGDIAYSRDMNYGNEHALWSSNDKSSLVSVRCLQD